MAEWLGSALVQETVSRTVSFGLSRREEKASQVRLMERLQMSVSRVQFALERAQELPIRQLSLFVRRKKLKLAYVEAMKLIDRINMQQALQEQAAQGEKRKRWILCSAKYMSITSSFARLSTDEVQRFEWYVDQAGLFLRDLESGCSLHHYNFCNPIVRHLLEGKTLRYCLQEQGNLLRQFFMCPVYLDERGMEVVLRYFYEDSTMLEKCFDLFLILRLSESTDIVQVVTRGLQYLTPQFQLPAESAMRELTLLYNLQDIAHSTYNLQDIAHSIGPPWVRFQECHINVTQMARPDPACCQGISHGLCANNYVSSELTDIFPEQVIFFGFSSFHIVGRSKSRGGGKARLLLTANFVPHCRATTTQDSYAFGTIRDVKERSDATIQQAAETIKLKAINCFLHQPELTEYRTNCFSRHGGACFTVEKVSTERAGGILKTRRYNTRGSTRRRSRR